MSTEQKQYRELRGSVLLWFSAAGVVLLIPLRPFIVSFTRSMNVHRKVNVQEAEQTAKSLLGMLGFREPETILSKYPFELSGGMAQRVAIALAVVNEPAFLLADEPTSALDVVVQKQTLDVILDMRQKLHMTMLMVTHNMGVVAYMADKVGVMHHGHLVEWGKKTELLKNPQHPYTRELIRAIPTMNGILPQYQETPQMKGWKNKVWYSETHWALMA